MQCVKNKRRSSSRSRRERSRSRSSSKACERTPVNHMKVFKVYYDLPAGGASSGGVESLDGKAASDLLIGLRSQSVEPASTQVASSPLMLEDADASD